MTDHTTPDIPMLRKLVEWVESEDAKPEAERTWQQLDWVDWRLMDAAVDRSAVTGEREVVEVDCGTKACVCGHLGALNGAVFTTTQRHRMLIDGLDPNEYGARELGITIGDAHWLFDASNTAADVRRIAEQIAGEPL